MGDGRIIRDALHGDIEISDDVRRIIDTRTFQRLRYIGRAAGRGRVERSVVAVPL